MAELLLELLSEEIPARMQARAAEDLKRLVTGKLTEAGLTFDKAEAYVTPRRLTLVVDGLPEKQPDQKIERKGPRVGAPEKAVQGFLKSAGLQSIDQCQVQEIKGAQFYVAIRERKGLKASEILPSVIYEAVRNLPWPKSMGWGEALIRRNIFLDTPRRNIIAPLDFLLSNDREEPPPEDRRDIDRRFRWVRPLHGIIAISGGKTLLGAIFAGGRKVLEFSAQTAGHRFLAPGSIQVMDFADYEAKLRNAKVILDAAERSRLIEREAAKKAKAEGLSVKPDPELVAENAGMVEWPVVLMGGIDPAFMDLPPEVLTTVMRHHLKHFALLDKDGNLAPRFLVVANTEAADGGKQIVAGNERVLRARLADAKFFWDNDRKRTLERRVADLDEVVFHAKLGSLGEKARRIELLGGELAAFVPGADADAVREAARLCKADLTTEMVGEFPELQGVMGRHYALGEGKPEEVADAIAEHYAPLGPNDACPDKPASVAVALADKIDTLVGLFAIDERPTGSKDPYALRRAALGVIRLILENEITLPLAIAFDEAIQKYLDQGNKTVRSAIDTKMSAANRTLRQDIKKALDIYQGLELYEFFADRLKVALRESGVRHDLVSAVFSVQRPGGGFEDDLFRLVKRVEALQEFLSSDDGEHLLVAYRRAANIVRIEEKRDGASYGGVPDAKVFRQDEEKALHAGLAAGAKASAKALGREDFGAAMTALAGLRGPVDTFFDEVTVNCDDKELRANRLRLLSQIRATMDTVADFSKIDPPSRSPLRRAKIGGGER